LLVFQVSVKDLDRNRRNEGAMISDAYCITSEASEDSYDETDSLEEPSRRPLRVTRLE
jgi:hypothetical protein